MRTSLPFLLCAVLAAPALAQDPPAAPEPPTATIIRPGEPKMVFEREVFSYPGRARRDPFRPLTGTSAGPLFDDLLLKAILHSPDPARSVVLLTDAEKKEYRLHRGESVGNATVVDIGPTRVVFSVVDFGIRKQAVLDLKANGRERN